VLHCSGYPSLFGLDGVTSPSWHVSFDVIVLNFRRRTMAYVASFLTGLYCLILILHVRMLLYWLRI
jgi:hypothetical protein